MLHVFKDDKSYTCQMWTSVQNKATFGHSGAFHGGVNWLIIVCPVDHDLYLQLEKMIANLSQF